jgi:hypothetical protein
MPLHHAVLALLADKPAHGYELKNSELCPFSRIMSAESCGSTCF